MPKYSWHAKCYANMVDNDLHEKPMQNKLVSLVFHDFVAKCLTKEPRLRPTAAEMLKHKFIEKCQCGASAMLPKIEEARKIRASMERAQSLAPADSPDNAGGGPKLNEDYGDTVPSKPPNAGVKLTKEVSRAGTIRKSPMSDGFAASEEGDFGTVIVHDRDEIGKASSLAEYSTVKKLPVPGQVESYGQGGTLTDFRVENDFNPAANADTVGASHEVERSTEVPFLRGFTVSDQNLKSTDAQGKSGDSSDLNSNLLKNETVSKKAFALQDKLWSIYAAGNTVPIPFLRATDISPIALLSDNLLRDNTGSISGEALQELFTGDGQSKKGRRGQNEIPLPPSVHQRLASSSTLLNLSQALAYHKMCHEEMPLQELQAAQSQQTIQNLSDTLRTILRL